jgi:hypothetical protein
MIFGIPSAPVPYTGGVAGETVIVSSNEQPFGLSDGADGQWTVFVTTDSGGPAPIPFSIVFAPPRGCPAGACGIYDVSKARSLKELWAESQYGSLPSGEFNNGCGTTPSCDASPGNL